jgi:hypothetical protein
MALTCTPKALLANPPCAACFSEKELDTALVVAMAASASLYTLPDQTSTMMQDGACFTCLSNKQLKQALLSAFLQSIIPALSITEIRRRMKCLACATPKQILALQAYLTCKTVR